MISRAIAKLKIWSIVMSLSSKSLSFFASEKRRSIDWESKRSV